jgi:hypothetical protein
MITYIHTYIHTHIQTYSHTYIHTEENIELWQNLLFEAEVRVLYSTAGEADRAVNMLKVCIYACMLFIHVNICVCE